MYISHYALMVGAIVVLAIGCYIVYLLLPGLLEILAWPAAAAFVGLIVYELVDKPWAILPAALAAILVLACGVEG
jgi:hypothetical protein